MAHFEAQDEGYLEARTQFAPSGIEGSRPSNVSKFGFSKYAFHLEGWPLVIGKENVGELEMDRNIGVFNKVVGRTMGIPKPLRSPA